MTALRSALDNLLHRKNDFCCLCLSIIYEKHIHIHDDVAVNISQEELNLPVSEVLTSVLGDEITDYLLTFEHVCSQCVLTAIHSYTFAKESKVNSQLLTNTINGLYDTFGTVNQPSDCNSLFVSINTEDFTTKQLYDDKRPVYNVTAAHRRFRSMINSPKLKPKVEIELYPEGVKKEKQMKGKGKCLIPIRTSEMIHDTNDSIIKCKECLKIFSTKLALRNHYIRVHAPKTYKCSQCHKKFGSPAYLEAHISESHCEIICSHCGKTFNNKHTFKLHEMGHFMRFVCQDCGRVYKNKTTFKKHIELNVCGQQVRASPSDAKFTCDYCNKKYTQKVSLRVHIQYEHGNYKAHECEFCKKKFWAKSRLKAHMVKHTKERNFACDQCDGKFVTKESLLYHTRIHTGDKPYPCTHCNARFLSASRRSEHVKRQHTNATLECNICGSKFNSQNYLHKHKKTHIESANTQLEPEVSLTVPTQKFNTSDLKQLTHDLKKMENQDYTFENEQMSEEESFFKLKFLTTNEEEYIVQISDIK
ncbi:hypothetical protein ABMA27_010189 [Loxostege sticticalis]|uniref:C2H2-type domain-containing protein n=1 Tax=Loxostege sticticalis TaxID=481309 RepID=A0ABR3H4Y3_LOXSC